MDSPNNNKNNNNNNNNNNNPNNNTLKKTKKIFKNRPIFSGSAIFLGIFIFIVSAIFAILMFERDVPILRSSLMNPAASIIIVLIICSILYNVRGDKTIIFGSEVDTTLLIYIFFVLFFLFSSG